MDRGNECSDSGSSGHLLYKRYDSGLEARRGKVVMTTTELTALIDLLTKYARISRQGGFSEQAEDALSLRDNNVRGMIVGRQN